MNKTDRQYRPWSAEEDAHLRKLVARHGWSQRRIADAMGRTIGSTLCALRRLGLITTGGAGGRPRRI